jgi:hypothetical protein
MGAGTGLTLLAIIPLRNVIVQVAQIYFDHSDIKVISQKCHALGIFNLHLGVDVL